MPANNDIVKAVKSGKCILFLGAMASAESPPGCRYQYRPAPISGRELSRRLAKDSNYPDEDVTNLQRVSLHYQYREGGSRNGLVEAIKEQVSNPLYKPSQALQMLAALPFPIIITTNYDHLFDQALRRAKTMTEDAFKDPIQLIYNADLQRAPDLAPLDPTEEKPVLVKLHGDVDRPDSIVVTEEDYLIFIKLSFECCLIYFLIFIQFIFDISSFTYLLFFVFVVHVLNAFSELS